MPPSSPSILEAVFNHATLPARLPGRQDPQLHQTEQALVSRLLDAAKVMGDLYNGSRDSAEPESKSESWEKESSHRKKWESVRRALQSCKFLNVDGRLKKATLLQEFRSLLPGDLLVLNIAEQNAGLLISRVFNSEKEDCVLFEALEASPLSESVLASEGALVWDFPGSAAIVAFHEFNKSSFQDELSAFLERASTESIKRFAPQTSKASSFTFESRDTVAPALISQILIPILEVIGQPCSSKLLRKRIRDEVYWNDGEKPWRRSPLWLVVRVALQRYLSTLYGGESGRMWYKFHLLIFFTQLLSDGQGYASPESLAFLKAKLCRRIVKLECDKDRSTPQYRPVYDYLFSKLQPMLFQTIDSVSSHIKNDWEDFKQKTHRRILPIPYRAHREDLRLTLSNCSSYIMQAMQRIPDAHLVVPLPSFKLLKNDNASLAMSFAQRYFTLSQIEQDAEIHTLPSELSLEDRCLMLSHKLETYLNKAWGAYQSNVEQNSIMLLTIMVYWVSIDESATQLFPTLKDFSPGLLPDMLNVLNLPSFKDMHRLLKVQSYLQARVNMTGGCRTTIFEDPGKDCFAEKFFDTQPHLQTLLERIEITAEEARQRKEEEWKNMTAEYESLVKTYTEGTCLYTVNENQEKIHSFNCPKCSAQRRSERMQIRSHEHPLPERLPLAKSVVVELNLPKAFAAYRDITFRVLSVLATAHQTESLPPKLLLCDYSELREFRKSAHSRVTLASRSKSFLSTHYAVKRFPVSLSDVCLPNGLKMGYYSTSMNAVWTSRLARPCSFAHLCQIIIPPSSPFRVLQSTPGYEADSKEGPSSNSIIASQGHCPPGLNVHEFMAYQGLYSGKSRRWPQLLIELGSPNLNFSTEAVSSLVCHLSGYAGPLCESDSGEPLRQVHAIFRDKEFCWKLINNLRERLNTIYIKDTYSMDMIVTLTLKICSIFDPKSPGSLQTPSNISIYGAAMIVLKQARMTLIDWIVQLRNEIQQATDASTSQKLSRYSFLSSILARKTFRISAENSEVIDAKDLECFIVSSVTFQDNMVGDPASLSLPLKNALVCDLKMAWKLGSILRRSFELYPNCLISAISGMWSEMSDSDLSSDSGPVFQDSPYEWWVMQQTAQYRVSYHLLEGHLLINGQPLGKLPTEHRKSMVLDRLFGKEKSLLTYPSQLPGMKYVLAIRKYGHKIHIGFRDNSLFVRAVIGNKILEYIPQEVFGNPTNFDLPASLVEDCVHWLDLSTGCVEVRRGNDIWRTKQSNWVLDFYSHRAFRSGYGRNGAPMQSVLVDPRSRTFQRISQMFLRFEWPQHLTVYQPETKSLKVELRRLGLSFFVNPKNLLESSQLRSEIDPNQDAGTWYGLDSKIVLRDTRSPRRRTIITPLGPITYKRNGNHIAIAAQNVGTYGRFTINDVLGRLECASEPLVLYKRAEFHAYTSAAVPDPLTGRTGSEEALSYLQSGQLQPWSPLTPAYHEILVSISHLTPRREYYPNDLKYMQRVYWDPEIPTTMQHDDYRPLVEAICQKSQNLAVFAPNNFDASLEPIGESHLLVRSSFRRQNYQRVSTALSKESCKDMIYTSRDRFVEGQRRLNVIEVIRLIMEWPGRIQTTKDLAGILQNWSEIGGHDRKFDKILLSDLLDVNFSAEWGSLVNLCRAFSSDDKYKAMFLFGVLSFRNDVDMDVIRTLVAFTILEDLKMLQPPLWSSYQRFRSNQTPSISSMLQLIMPCKTPYPGDERSMFEWNLNSKQRRKLEARQFAYEQQSEEDCKIVAKFFLDQWPCLDLKEEIDGTVLVNIAQAVGIVLPEWQRLYHNFELAKYINEVQLVLDKHTIEVRSSVHHTHIESQSILPERIRGLEHIEIYEMLCKTGPRLKAQEGRYIESTPLQSLPNGQTPKSLQNFDKVKSKYHPESCETLELSQIIDNVFDSKSTVRQQYSQDLKSSLTALTKLERSLEVVHNPINLEDLSNEIKEAEDAAHLQFLQIISVLERDDARVPWLKRGHLFPCITPIILLEQLRSKASTKFGKHMKESIVAYGVSITKLLRLRRIEDALRQGNNHKLVEEQQNTGHINWQPLDHPDWLLLEIEADIMIRPDQVNVALATISPASGANSVLQLMMGQGKTSVVMPLVAATLANSKNILRLVVPAPLLLQTAQLMTARLGGLLGREITHLPFSRKTSTSPNVTKLYHEMHKMVLKSSGVMVVLPEHILSFMLSGLQRLSDGRIPEAIPLVNVQSWLTKKCRDVLDECDFTLAVRTQLIYPSGTQTTVDGFPHRWETAEALLRLVEGQLFGLQSAFPQSIEVIQRPNGGFPVIFFLRRDAEDALSERLVNDICTGHTAILPIRDCKNAERSAIKKFISDPKVSQTVVGRIARLFPDQPAVKKTIYLLRGLLVHRILLLALKKRWNVQYGLHPGRDPIAVPYHAKGLPSDQAEWGHPDVAILFTCLTFYYDGLNVIQLRQALEHVLKSDDPSSEYSRWTISSDSLPDSLKEWNTVNVDDEIQLQNIWQCLRYSVVVIDYFLNNFVFPKHAKQFKVKLQASGWDIPLPNGSTTGFSGTSDTILPLTIKQQDLPGLSHTNAEVLTYLLQPRSREYILAADHHGKHLGEADFLKYLRKMEIRILIDSGAKILELDNLSLAKAWLAIDSDAPAIIYFGPGGRPFVLYRNHVMIPLAASPFSENPGNCLVYLDDAHTRGTDLKLPATARGALTLGLNSTKDTTVQAAMRLRQLGSTQSVVFFAPPEVHQNILDVCGKSWGDSIDSSDVIYWLLEQTCDAIESLQPLYYSQGVDYCRRIQAALDLPDFLSDLDQREEYLEILRQKEQQTLAQLYKPSTRSKAVTKFVPASSRLAGYIKDLNVRRKNFHDNGKAVHGSALQEVEQEREVAVEVETVRELQKPTYYTPIKFSGLHRDILSFVKTGRLAADSAGYERAFKALRRYTATGLHHGINDDRTSSSFYVSTEFFKTIHMPANHPNDNFVRQVNWIIWSPSTEVAILIVPEEAEIILPMLLWSENCFTHLLSYSAPITRRSLQFNNLTYYSVPKLPTSWQPPTWLRIELGIFAGRLYFDYSEYKDLCDYLDLHESAGSLEETTSTLTLSPLEASGADGLDEIGGEEKDGEEDKTVISPAPTSSFTRKPLHFLHDWLSVRRKGQDFMHTPMGFLCQGKALEAKHPFFSTKVNSGIRVHPKVRSGEGVACTEEQTVDEEMFADDDGMDCESDGEDHEKPN